MNEAKQAFDYIYGDMSLSDNDAAFNVFLEGFNAGSKFEQVEQKVIQWAKDRQIIPNATPVSQLLKMVSEVGELCDAEGKRNNDLIIAAVGDVLVCLINYCALRNIDPVVCFEIAYETIKHRKGTLMPDGTFIKEVE